MTGIVLSGGQSLRMGKDKGLLQANAQTWVQLAVQKLQALSIPVAVSVNQRQLQLYSQAINNVLFITDNPSIPVKGPLLGILSAHKQFPNEDLFVLACDMVDMNIQVLQHLISIQKKHPIYDAWLFETDGQQQPLCAIFSAQALSVVFQKAKSGNLKKFSMKYILENINVYVIDTPQHWIPFFQNFNTPTDISNLGNTKV